MNPNNTYVAIMAGGVGSRFWPASREALPKQFLDIMGIGKSLIRLTFERFLKLCPAQNIFIVTNTRYKSLVKLHLPEITDNQILCEPSRNNTAPCVAYTSFKLFQLNPEANFIVAPSDALILKEDVFIEKITQALEFTASNNALCTLGIYPTRPDTGYGYINFQKDSNKIKKVNEFKEKPDLKTAESYIDSGNYLWNAGIFIWKAQSILEAFKIHSKQIYEVLEKGRLLYNTPKEQVFINSNYPLTDKISVDYAIMEKAKNIYTIPADIGWSDLGSWGSVFAESEKDNTDNAINTTSCFLDNVSNCLIRGPKDKLIVLKDLNDYIIIDEGDILLIYPKSKEQEIKEVTNKLKEKGQI